MTRSNRLTMSLVSSERPALLAGVCAATLLLAAQAPAQRLISVVDGDQSVPLGQPAGYAADPGETITYVDSNKDIVDLSISFSRKLGEPMYANALVGNSMMMLSPELSQDGRRDLIIRLLQNADE